MINICFSLNFRSLGKCVGLRLIDWGSWTRSLVWVAEVTDFWQWFEWRSLLGSWSQEIWAGDGRGETRWEGTGKGCIKEPATTVDSWSSALLGALGTTCHRINPPRVQGTWVVARHFPLVTGKVLCFSWGTSVLWPFSSLQHVGIGALMVTKDPRAQQCGAHPGEWTSQALKQQKARRHKGSSDGISYEIPTLLPSYSAFSIFQKFFSFLYLMYWFLFYLLIVGKV